MDTLDQKLTSIFEGKVVRKDLLHRIKKGTNVPTFVLEFLLARFCASDDPSEIQAGLEAVLDTLNDNYVRPNESNIAQSKVATKGKYKFIDKVHVNYVEKDRRHWAALENFDSRKVAISEKFYRDHDRLLQGGLWAEVTVAYNEIEDDDYTFYIEDLRPIQLSRFDFDKYCAGRAEFSRNEWLDVILRSVGLEPAELSHRRKFHYIARLLPFVEANFNFIELGPRGTGKSYFFSEFSPYSHLLGQLNKTVLFYHNQKKKIGLVGFWDTIAFDEVSNLIIKDEETSILLKGYMANGRFSRGVDVIANASMAFVGNFDLSVEQVVHSEVFDLLQPLPKEFDLAVIDRFALYLPGWEMPKNSSDFLTKNYGFITDYLAEAFHYQLKQTNRYEEVNKRIKLGSSIEGRDEPSIKKTVAAFLKILHPTGSPSDEEFEEYVAYAIESRRRVKEQMNKRKSDDEFANIDLSYFDKSSKEIIVYCPESKKADATQNPLRKNIHSDQIIVEAKPKKKSEKEKTSAPKAAVESVIEIKEVVLAEKTPEPKEQHFTIHYGATGYSYESIISPYLLEAKAVEIEDPYVRVTHQIQNFVRFCEVVVKIPTIRKITLCTSFDDETDKKELADRLADITQSLLELDVELSVKINDHLHDREIRIDNGWVIKIGRGLDFYQKPDSWYSIGSNDLSLRKCLETKVDIFKRE